MCHYIRSIEKKTKKKERKKEKGNDITSLTFPGKWTQKTKTTPRRWSLSPRIMCPSGKSSVFVFFRSASSRYTYGDGEMAIIFYWQQMLARVASEELRGKKRKSIVPFELVRLKSVESPSWLKLERKWCKCASMVVSYTYTYVRTGRCMLMSISHLSITHSYSNKKKKEEKGNLSFFFLCLSLSVCCVPRRIRGNDDRNQLLTSKSTDWQWRWEREMNIFSRSSLFLLEIIDDI